MVYYLYVTSNNVYLRSISRELNYMSERAPGAPINATKNATKAEGMEAELNSILPEIAQQKKVVEDIAASLQQEQRKLDQLHQRYQDTAAKLRRIGSSK